MNNIGLIFVYKYQTYPERKFNMTTRHIYVIGVNYKTTPIEIREQFNIEIQDYKEILINIMKIDGILECALLSTCNRTELHLVTDKAFHETGVIEEQFCALKGVVPYHVKKYFNVYEGMNAINHIIKVASGMDSMILGEDQILGQFKRAYEISMKQGTSKSVLNTLSRLAITSSKKIKTRNIYLGKAHSVAGRAVWLLDELFGVELKNKRVLMIGSGEMGQLVAQELQQKEVTGIQMTKRNMASVDKVQLITHNIEYVDYADRYQALLECDIIISATSSPHYTITKDVLEGLIRDTHRDFLFIDLAVPRDIDTLIREINHVRLYHMDDISSLGDKEAKNIKQMDLEYIQEQIDLHTEEFIRWYQYHNAYSSKKEE